MFAVQMYPDSDSEDGLDVVFPASHPLEHGSHPLERNSHTMEHGSHPLEHGSHPLEGEHSSVLRHPGAHQGLGGHTGRSNGHSGHSSTLYESGRGQYTGVS